jgi:CheY-like chemotaxis protein
VLVVDASPARLDAATAALNALGIEVAAGGPDESGYLRALEFQPDAVLSDLTTPGEPGWWLFQRFRRQPLVKWTPVLLMRWFEEDSGGAPRVLVARVVERINEVLAPIRVIEDRITAGRALADRVEVTGMPALLRLLRGAQLTGALSVNDSWNVFDIGLSTGRVTSVVRRGVDGETDSGAEAFLQLLVCDSGRWSFRSQDSSPRPENMRGDLTENMDRAGRVLASVFGPSAAVGDEAQTRLGVRQPVMRDLASSLTGTARQIVEGLAAGVSAAEIDGLLRDSGDLVSAERALINLMRCGAVRPAHEPRDEDLDDRARGVARAVTHLLSRVAEDHRAGSSAGVSLAEEVVRDQPASQPAGGDRGFYRVSKVMAERVASKAREGMSVPGARLRDSGGVGAGPASDSVKLQFEAGTPTPVLEPESAAWEAGMGAGVLPRDSFVPAPTGEEEGRGNRQMWLALALALLLGGLLVIGLIAIGSGEREVPEAPGGP